MSKVSWSSGGASLRGQLRGNLLQVRLLELKVFSNTELLKGLRTAWRVPGSGRRRAVGVFSIRFRQENGVLSSSSPGPCASKRYPAAHAFHFLSRQMI